MAERMTVREAARLELARSAVRGGATLERALEHAVRLSAQTLDVARVGVWMFEAEQTAMRCCLLYDRAGDRITSGEVLSLDTVPRYATALRSRRAIKADDALTDPQTSELADYLREYGIASMLDSPIFRQGEVVGVVCHEHVGAPRVWSKPDVMFVATISDMLGLYLEQDATERTYRELLATREALERTRMLESLGRLAGGVAHDFNHLLGAIGLKNELLRRKLGSDAFVATLSNDFEQLVDQGARLVKQLVSFAQRDAHTTATSDLAAVVRMAVPSVRALLPEGQSLELGVEPGAFPVRAGRGRLEQLVLNLAINARDAMPLEGGVLMISLERDAAHAESVLRVIDNGVGMDEATLGHLFEPFFTTKGGRGTGLGLATVHGIVTDSGGRIAIASELGRGTTFEIRWPAAEATQGES